MKTAIILIAACLQTTHAGEVETPQHTEPPPLNSSDIAWMEGISYTKGILPVEESLRIGSVSLVVEYENGKRETLIEPIRINYNDKAPEHLRSQVREVLVAMKIVDGEYEFFLGCKIGSLRTSKKKSISIRDVGTRITNTFERQTGPLETGSNFEVLVGESEIFTFRRTNSEPLAKVIVVSEPVDADNPVNPSENSKNQPDD